MTSHAAALTIISDDALLRDAERVAAAAGVRLVSGAAVGRRGWLAASAVLLDGQGALHCVQRGLPRRERVIVLAPTPPASPVWAAAVTVGAAHVFTLPEQETQVVRVLADALEGGVTVGTAGRVITVLPGRGGGGASVLATAMAQCAGDALLIDLDTCGGGIDLLSGTESDSGLRWPDLGTHGGRLGWPAVRAALPRRGAVSVLSAGRAAHELEPELVGAVIDAGRRAGVTVICDAPRHLSGSTASAVELADLVTVVTSCDVRGIAATAALAGAVRTINDNIGLVVRGPAPGGLSARDAVEVIAAPLLAALRPEPMLAEQLERGGLRLHRRSRLAGAARLVLAAAGGVRGNGAA